jgi:hypothetical protein
MIDHENNLTQILKEQKLILNEIQELNNTLAIKKEQFLKLQGIVEYLSANGVKPQNSEEVVQTEQN